MENRRVTKACARCRTRKIKCDLKFPSCGSCSKAGAECLGFNAAQRTEQPRSTVSHLEHRVALLEIELANLRANEEATALESVNVAVEHLTTRLATAIGSPGGVIRDSAEAQSGELPLTSDIFLSPSSSPTWSRGRRALKAANSTPATNILSVPRPVIDIMLQNYCSIYLPQYPCVDEQELYAACDRIYQGDAPSRFDTFIVTTSLAISANTLIQHDEERATKAVEGFWALAVEQLDHITGSPWQRLQALLLMTHFSLLNPLLVNCSNCTAAATRLCFQLGLHRELPPWEQSFLNKDILNTRRRLFWTAFSNESAIKNLSHQPFIWLDTSITAKYPEVTPTVGGHGFITNYIWSLRRMTAEINLAMHHPQISHESGLTTASFPIWFKDMHQRLDDWFHSVRNDNDMSRTIEFYEIHYRSQIFMLNTITPRCPTPNIEMRKRALKSSLMLIDQLNSMHRLRKLFNIYAWSFWIVEYGLSLLESIIAGLEAVGQRESHIDNIDVAVLTRTVRSVPVLLHQLSDRYAPLEEAASTVESLSTPVLKALEKYAAGDLLSCIPEPDIKLRLQELLLPSLSNGVPNPASESRVDNDLGFGPDNIDMLIATSEEHELRRQHSLASRQDTPSHSETDLDKKEMPFLTPAQDTMAVMPLPTDLENPLAPILPFDPSWSIDNAFQQWYDQPYPSTDFLSTDAGTDDMSWDVAGLNSNDILAALLDYH